MNDQARISYNERLEAWKDKFCECSNRFPLGRSITIMGVECVVAKKHVEKEFDDLQLDLIFKDGGSLGKITLSYRAVELLMEDGT